MTRPTLALAALFAVPSFAPAEPPRPFVGGTLGQALLGLAFADPPAQAATPEENLRKLALAGQALELADGFAADGDRAEARSWYAGVAALCPGSRAAAAAGAKLRGLDRAGANVTVVGSSGESAEPPLVPCSTVVTAAQPPTPPADLLAKWAGLYRSAVARGDDRAAADAVQAVRDWADRHAPGR